MKVPSIYTTDWYNRDNEDYILTNEDLEIGFVNIPSKQYSRFLYNEDRVERICNDHSMIIAEMKDLLRSMGLHNVSFRLSKDNETASTNGSTIKVGLGKTIETVDDAYDKMDRLIGMTIHESCHCLYTDFTYLNSVISKYPELVHHIHNVLEDELIEEKICHKFPGYSNFLSKLKYQIFKKYEEDVSNPNNTLSEILAIFFYIIRYPKYLSSIKKDSLIKYEDLFKKIKYIVRDNDCFDIKNELVTRSTTAAAIQIYELLKEYINNSKKEESKGESKNSSSGDSKDSKQSDDSDNSDDPEIEVRDKDDDIFKNQEASEMGGNGIIGILSNIYEDISSESECTNIKKMIVYHTKISENNNDNILEDHNIPGMHMKISKDVHMVNANYPVYYNQYLNTVKNYINYAKKLIIPNSYSYEIKTDRFRRNGSLDPNRLVNAMCNEQTVYTQKRTVIKSNDPEYALVLAIDESGSMTCDKLNELASAFSIMIYEALKDYPKIKLFVYGHGDRVYRYLDPFTLKSKYTLGNRNSQGGQNEAESYRIIAEDVKGYTSLPIVVFNITDSCYIADANRIKETLDNLRNDVKQPTYFNLIALGHNAGIGTKLTGWNDSLYGEGNWVIYNRSRITFEIKTLIDEFTKIIRKNFK